MADITRFFDKAYEQINFSELAQNKFVLASQAVVALSASTKK